MGAGEATPSSQNYTVVTSVWLLFAKKTFQYLYFITLLAVALTLINLSWIWSLHCHGLGCASKQSQFHPVVSFSWIALAVRRNFNQLSDKLGKTVEMFLEEICWKLDQNFYLVKNLRS
jgi:hypothetical protein